METVKLKKRIAKKVAKGYPLIEETDLVYASDKAKIKQIVDYVDERGQYLGSGYLGKQNKGIGWVLTNKKEVINHSFFKRIFETAFAKREAFRNNHLTTAYRLLNGEGDGLGGLTIDIYGDFALFTWYNESIYSLKPLVMDAFNQTFSVKGIYEKNRFEAENIKETQHIQGDEAPEPLLVQENGVTYATYLNEGMMTGIFLDQKNVRGRLVDGLASGLSVLNTFSYTGAFSVAAAIGGAVQTVSVDLAKRSRAKTEEMFQANHLSLENNQIVVMDIFEYIRYAKRKQLSFDMVILDPPGFARNKKKSFSVVKNYGELVMDIAPLIQPKGYLIASTNVANLSYERFCSMVEEGLKKAQRGFSKVEEHRLPEDFVVSKHYPEGNYLKVLIYRLT